ncbi:MAG: NAD-dependent epimerase/dehydratase family protein [Sporocytophaga sp.]|nr:NAD-dependent epimerase/dehydratase family protein [Sporocytophaga sp.]
MKKILVTGGAGNVGGSLVEVLLKNRENYVVVVDNLITGSLSKIPFASFPNFKFIKADVNNYDEIAAIMLSFQFNYVFHYAALVGVKRTLDNPIKVLDDIQGIKNILNLSKNTGVNRVFYSSSSEVYGEPVEYPQNEHTTPLNSRLPYAIVKNVGEAFLKSFHKEYGMDYTIFRFFNTYGPRQSQDFVLSKFLKAAMNNEDITIYGDGSQTRTFCFIEDNLDVTVKSLENNHCINDVMNVGNDHETSVLELASKIIEITNSKSKIIHLPPLQEGDMTRRMPDTSKMKKILGRELTSLESGITRIVNEWKNYID